jgi:hypothetical protein
MVVDAINVVGGCIGTAIAGACLVASQPTGAPL